MRSPFAWPLLVADIGGTNTRVGVFDGPQAPPRVLGRFATQECASIEEAIAELARAAPATPRSAFLAAAGPVTGMRMGITNATRFIDGAILGERLRLEAVAIVNDFTAQAAAIARLGAADMRTLFKGDAKPRGTRLAVGPGTGFGVGFVAAAGDGFAVIASEGGHAGLGPETAEEWRLWPHLEGAEGRITIESAVSGEGLPRLWRACAAADGEAATSPDPAGIVAAARAGDKRAGAAVGIFTGLLARAAADLALIAKATGGVFICGGVAPRLLPLIDPAAFRGRFIDRAPMREMLEEVPIHVVTADEPAFLGLAALADSSSSLRASEMALWRG